LSGLLVRASTIVSSKLYLKLPSPLYTELCLQTWKELISVCYATASTVTEVIAARKFEVIITDSDAIDNVPALDVARKLGDAIGAEVQCWPVHTHTISLSLFEDCPDGETQYVGRTDKVTVHSQSSVCLGGTFDQLHNGHRVLLSVAALLAQRRLLVGVTDASMLQRKVLAPLIQAYDERCQVVADFLRDINCTTKAPVTFARLTDHFGPPISDPDFTCIIASPESLSVSCLRIRLTWSCQKINQLRSEKDFPPLHIEEIQFTKGEVWGSAEGLHCPSDWPEEKISSSTYRLQLLGRLLRSPRPQAASGHDSRRRPYVIGLAGPAGSGKSSICRHLSDFGGERLSLLPADQIAHGIYEPGTRAYHALIENFAPDVIICSEPPHRIDRKKLGGIVFSSPDKLRTLNGVVWPEIAQSLKEEITRIQSLTPASAPLPVVVIDAALLFDAGWDKLCDEVWVSYVPRDACERRLAERQKISLEEAKSRLISQSAGVKSTVGDDRVDWWTPCQRGSNTGPIAQSNVVFCTEWEVPFTRSQVERAWQSLLTRIDRSSS
uniref:CTP_transf_like domain-containing protein n=1 Tax=Schistocephalus solidus TaxID=70667 RepID=A0A183SYE9_SCHSO